MRIYIIEYNYLNFQHENSNEVIDPMYITEDNKSTVGMQRFIFVYCYDIGEDEYAIGTSYNYKLVVKKEDITDEYNDTILSLYDNGWLNFYLVDTEKSKDFVKTNDRFALSLLTTPRKSNTLFIIHPGLNMIGKVTNKFVLETVRYGTYESEIPPTHDVHWYTLRLPPPSEKNEVHILYTLLRGLKFMYQTKNVIYNKTKCIYNGMIDPYAFDFEFKDSRKVLKFIIDKAKKSDAFNNIYNEVKKLAERLVEDDKDLLYKIATIYDTYAFIEYIYPEYIESYVNIMKEYFEAIFKDRIPEKSPIEIAITDFESKYKKKIEQ